MEAGNKLVLAADCVRKDPNISGLIRLADAAAAESVYFIRFKPGQFHAACGAQRFVACHYKEDGSFLDGFRAACYQIVGVETILDAPSYDEIDYGKKVVLVFGSETNGIRPSVSQFCDSFVRIPQFGNKKSLNVVGAAHVVTYEVLRQWKRQSQET